MPGFNHGFNPGLNRVGQNSKNPLTVGENVQNVIKFWASWKLKRIYETQYGLMTMTKSLVTQ